MRAHSPGAFRHEAAACISSGKVVRAGNDISNSK
jgi:hypothetical protein